MILEAFDKFEYNYIKLSTSINKSINELNYYGNEGWELIHLESPKMTGDIYRGLMKRKITRTQV